MATRHSMPYNTKYDQQTLVTSRGKSIACDQPYVGLVVCYKTSLMSDGHNYPTGYIVTGVYHQKIKSHDQSSITRTPVINKADISYIVSADQDKQTVEYTHERDSTMILSQAGRWYIPNGGGSDPYISFGNLQLPWTDAERRAHLEYSLGN